jgi:type I site-specific restriction endonuclease
VCGETPKDERKQILSDFREGRFKRVINCGVLTEGFDDAGVEVVLMGRPTKSRSLYAQCCGRGTRPLPGVVDGHEKDTPEQRKAAILASAKPSCLIVDFVGNAGRHKLMTTADILGGKVSDEAQALAVKRAKEAGGAVNMADELDKAEQDILDEIEERRKAEAARKAGLTAKAKFGVQRVNPFDLWDITPAKERGWDRGRQLSDKQRALLLKQGIDPGGMPYVQAKQLLNTMFDRWNKKLATLKQCNILLKRGIDAKGMTMEQAGAEITKIAEREGWRR